MEVFEAMSTCRAMRYLKTDEVSTDLIEQVITAATWAPSPGNSQGRDFVIATVAAPTVVKEPEKPAETEEGETTSEGTEAAATDSDKSPSESDKSDESKSKKEDEKTTQDKK